MSDQEEKSMPERFDAFMKRLMGYKPIQDPRKSEVPLFATFQDRVIASVIDTALIYILLQDVFRYITTKVFSFADVEALKAAEKVPQGASLVTQTKHFFRTAYETGLVELWLMNSFIQSLLIGVILVLMWKEFHCTPGKYVIGLEMAGKNGEGKPELKTYIKRYAGFYLSMPFFMFGFMWLGFDKQKRAWHDSLAGTTVIYSKRGSIFRQGWDLIKRQFKK